MLRKNINPFVIGNHYPGDSSCFQLHNSFFQKKILKDYYNRHEIKEIVMRLKSFSFDFNEDMLSVMGMSYKRFTAALIYHNKRIDKLQTPNQQQFN